MSQFSAAGKPPWARDALGQPGVAVVNNLGQAQISVPGNQGLLQQPGVANPTVYSLATTPMATAQAQYTNQQMGLQNLQATMQQASAALQQLPQPGIAMPTTLASSQVQTVSYPAPRAQVPPGGGAKQRVFTGTVTKLHDNFGFVDEDVFFQTSCVKGTVPKIGDRVLVEASYNANMPFKWNATRIQTVGGGQQQVNTVKPSAQMGRMGHNPPPLMAQSVAPQSGGMGNRDFAMPNNMGSRSSDRSRDRDKDRSERRSSPRRRSPGRKRSRSPKRRSRSRSPRRSSPRRRVARLAPRYTVQVPKITLDTKEANVVALRSRYNNMYIPSDFFNATFPWTDAFPLHRPFPLGHPCNFQVMHKEVDPIVPNVAVLEPPDADHLYSAKVMLLASPTIADLYHKSCALAEDTNEQRENFQHPTRLINFLVGLKGKEPMAIGGPWSPSLDGPNPNEDPRVLINTAIRTTRALTGIDLSACTQWYRFAEIRYHRPEEIHKGRLVPARVETVLIFLPDVWSCNPSRLEWDGLAVAYKRQLAEKYKEDQADETQEEEEESGEAPETKPDPTHYAELDPKTMKVTDLRRELEARSLSSKGLKSQLIARLTKTLKTEQETEEQKGAEEEKEEEPKPEEPKEPDEKDEEKKKREEEERKRREERERAVRERRYTLTGGPAVLVHPSTTAKQGKFDCTNMSLSVLLDYRHDDNKEHTFEVSLFAELYNEMLMRDFGFEIYKSLVKAPEKVREDRDKKDRRDRKDRDKDKDKDKKEDKDKDDKDKKDEKKDDKEKKEEEGKEKTDEKKEEDSAEPPQKKKKEDEKETASKDKKKEEKEEEEDKKDKEKSKEGEDEDNDDDKRSVSSSRRSRDREDRDRDRRRKEEKKEKEKMYTISPQLLLAFSYFDQSHTGYLQDKDCEEILHTLGLFLSRSQVKKLVSKVVSKEHVYYRKLTDRPLKEKEEKEKKEAEAAMETDQAEEEKKDVTEEPIDEETLAKGNKPLLPEIKTPGGTPSKGRAVKKTVEAGNLIMYNGAMLDIASMVQRLDKSEKTKHETDAKLKDLQEEMDMLKDSCKSSEQNSQKVALELQELKKKLRDQRKVTERAESDAKRYYESLANVKGNLTTALDTLRGVTEKTTPSPTKSGGDPAELKPDIKKEVNGD